MAIRFHAGRAAVTLALATTFIPASEAHADGEGYSGETIVVTAARSERGLDRAAARVSVITRADIERLQPPDMLELLRLEAGIDVARGGGPGGQTSVFMRGSNSNHVLVLVDGVRVAAAGTGAFTWEILDPAQIERIEIVRGPRAARWGSDAIGGVIQIFTRRGNGPSARVGYGRYNDRNVAAAVGDQSAEIPFDLALSWRKVGGFSSQNQRGFGFNADDDGFENLSASGGGRAQLGAGELSLRGRVAHGDTEFDQGQSDFTNWSGQMEYRHPGSGPWSWLASLGGLHDELETATAFGDSRITTGRIQTGAQAERRLGEHAAWLLGVDFWHESGRTRGVWSDDRYNVGFWSGVDGRHGAFDYELSVRVDENEHFGAEPTGNVAGGWRPHAAVRVFANLGRSFRAPNFNQLFSPGFFGQFSGNPNLDAETSWSGEVGADWVPLADHRLTVSAWQNRIDDLIDFSGNNFQAINIREARITGVELTHAYATANWRADTRGTWQDPEDRMTGNDLLRRPRYKINFSIDHRFGAGHWAGLEVVHNGRRFDVGQQQLPAYTLLNLRSSIAIGHGLRIEARLENVTDRNYEPLVGFNAHRRSLFVAIAWDG